MNTIGEQVKQYRDSNNISLEDLALVTKISKNNLRIIESGQFEKFKGDESYVKMYLKRIAKEIGADEKMFLETYSNYLQTQAFIEEEKAKEKPQIKTKKTKLPKKAPKQQKRVYGDSYTKRYFKYFVVFLFTTLAIFVVWSGILLSVKNDSETEYVAPSIGTVEQNKELEEKLEQERLEQERLEQELADKEAAELANPVIIVETSNWAFRATEMDPLKDVVIKVVFNSPSAFNLWSTQGQIPGAYRSLYEAGEEYVYTTTFVEGQSFTINLWDLTDVQIYINDKEVVYDKTNIPVSNGAHLISLTTIGAIENEPTE